MPVFYFICKSGEQVILCEGFDLGVYTIYYVSSVKKLRITYANTQILQIQITIHD